MGRRLLIIALLIVSLAYAIYTYWPLLFPAPKAAPATSAAPAMPGLPVKPAVSPEAGSIGQPEEEIFLPTIEARLVDPFAIRTAVVTRAEAPAEPETSAPGEKKAPPPEPVLEGIWYEPELKVAFISGQTAAVGGKVMGWTVTSISKERVVLQKGSAAKTLKLEGR